MKKFQFIPFFIILFGCNSNLETRTGIFLGGQIINPSSRDVTLYQGSKVGRIDYEKGHCSWTIASLPEAEFKVHGQSNSAHSGGIKYAASEYNSIQEIKARSINSIKDTTIEAIVLG